MACVAGRYISPIIAKTNRPPATCHDECSSGNSASTAAPPARLPTITRLRPKWSANWPPTSAATRAPAP